MATRRQGRQGAAARGRAVGATHSGDDDGDRDDGGDGGGGGDSGGGDEARRGGVAAAMRGTQWRRWRRRQR